MPLICFSPCVASEGAPNPAKIFSEDECAVIFGIASSTIGAFAVIEEEDIKAGKLKRGASVKDDAIFLESFARFLAPKAAQPYIREISDLLKSGNYEAITDDALRLMDCSGPRVIKYSLQKSETAYTGIAVRLLAPKINISFNEAGVTMKRNAASPTASPSGRKGR